MLSISKIIFSLAYASFYVLALPQEHDWKYSVGWNGQTLPASDIGSVVTSSNATHSQVHTVYRRIVLRS
jgi:hypothetical protein